jgi:hypothetical protein
MGKLCGVQRFVVVHAFESAVWDAGIEAKGEEKRKQKKQIRQ